MCAISLSSSTLMDSTWKSTKLSDKISKDASFMHDENLKLLTAQLKMKMKMMSFIYLKYHCVYHISCI